MTEAKIVTTAA